jgi:hypothetical protein
MLNLASLAMVLLATARPVTDTTITVKAGTRVVIDNFAGGIVVDTWPKNAVRVRAELSRRAQLDIEHSVARLDLSAHGKWGEPVFVDFAITVPAGTPIELTGVDTDIEVRGGEGAVKAETVKGDVLVQGAKGAVTCSSVEGEVVVLNARGRVEASAVNDIVRVVGATGVVQAESVNGDVFLEQLKAGTVEASTVNGEVYFVGDIQSDGDYSFSSHNGGIRVAVPVNANCSGSVSTYGGSFESSFPIERSDKKKRENDFTFTIGDGSARLELESFNGSIRLDRPEAVAQQIVRAHAEREAHAKGYKDKKTSASERKQEELERKMEQKERELERKLEQKEKAKDKREAEQEEEDEDKSPDSDPDDKN